MAYIYHYHAMRQMEGGNLQYNDGTVTCSLPIDSAHMFAEVRQVIADEIGANGPLAFNITSLTLLNPNAPSFVSGYQFDEMRHTIHSTSPEGT